MKNMIANITKQPLKRNYMQDYSEKLLLAFGGFLFHLLKLWYASVTRNESFINKRLLIWVAMNMVGSAILIYIGNQLPPDLIVMSPFTCVLIGAFGSSMLSGFINIKKPKDMETTTLETQDGTTKVTVEKQTPKP